MLCAKRPVVAAGSVSSWVRLWGAALLISAASVGARADNISFSTFVTAPNIGAAEGGNTSTIAFNYAGNKFVGSVYFGNDNNQLYQTNLTGGGVTQFGGPIPGASAEVVIGASLGQGGFAAGDIYTASEANTQIYHLANSGGSPTLFATLPGSAGAVRQIFFDPGSSFGGNMLVTTTAGQVFSVTSAGASSLIASVGEDTEGMDIATSAWGPFAGDLIVGSENSGTVRLINPTTHAVTVVGNAGAFPGAETISAIPLSLDGTDPLQGFYVSNYASNIQFAAASQFVTQGLLGDVIVTDEFGGSTAWDVHYNSGPGTFTITPFTFTGNQISQFEDGIFVTPQRISESGPGAPEPSSLLLLGTGILGFGAYLKRKRKLSS